MPETRPSCLLPACIPSETKSVSENVPLISKLNRPAAFPKWKNSIFLFPFFFSHFSPPFARLKNFLELFAEFCTIEDHRWKKNTSRALRLFYRRAIFQFNSPTKLSFYLTRWIYRNSLSLKNIPLSVITINLYYNTTGNPSIAFVEAAVMNDC